MSADAAVSMIERFFLDLIGTIIPGMVLLLGMQHWVLGPFSLGVPLDPSSDGFVWMLFAAVAYVLGHGITSLSDQFDSKLLKERGRGKAAKREQVKESGEYVFFVETLRSLPEAESLPSELDRGFHTYRNLAMSLAPEEDGKVYRFRFLSLLNGGIAAVLILLVILWVGAHLLPNSLIEPAHTINWPVALILLASAIFIFRERELYFFRITNQVPFSVAAVKLSSLNQYRKTAKGGDS